MKILSILLAIFILALSAQGCCTDDNCEDEGLLTQTEQKQHKDSCDSACSPFFNCGSCIGFTFSTPTFLVAEFLFIPLETQLVSHYHSQFLSQFSPAIWQPPKIS